MMFASMMPGRLTSKVASTLALALVVTFAIGCSADRHTYRSTLTSPKSVSVTYVNSGDTAWSYDIPTGEQLTLEFKRPGQFNGFKSPNVPATSMVWYTTELAAGRTLGGNPGKGKADDSGKVELSGQPVQINLSLRDASDESSMPAALDAVPAPPAAPEAPAPPVMEDIQVDEVEIPETPAVQDTVEDAVGDSLDAVKDGTNSVFDNAVDSVGDAADGTGDTLEEAAGDLMDK